LEGGELPNRAVEKIYSRWGHSRKRKKEGQGKIFPEETEKLAHKHRREKQKKDLKINSLTRRSEEERNLRSDGSDEKQSKIPRPAV